MGLLPFAQGKRPCNHERAFETSLLRYAGDFREIVRAKKNNFIAHEKGGKSAQEDSCYEFIHL